MKALPGYDTKPGNERFVVPQIHVCPLSQVPATVRATGARTLLTLINAGTEVVRPREIAEDQHLFVAMSDIVLAEDGHILPEDSHVETMLDFVRESWDRTAPLVVHCYAGVSRSTAAAFITACALNEKRCEREIAQTIRDRSPTATPNKLMVEIADPLLHRRGRMIEAVAAIGRGRDCYEGEPFTLELA